MMTTAAGSRESRSRSKNLDIGLALLIPLTVLGFWKTYFGILKDLPDTITPVIHIHAALMILWLFMLVAQAWFIRTRRFRPHAFVGRSSYVIAPLIVLSGLAALHETFNRGPDVAFAEVSRLNVLGFGQLLAFAAGWGLGILYRRQPALHVRFMISTALAVATAIVFRIFLLWVPGATLQGAVVANCVALSLASIALIGVDWRRGVKRSPYWVVAILLGLQHVGYWTFARTDGWVTFCRWFADPGVS